MYETSNVMLRMLKNIYIMAHEREKCFWLLSSN